MSSEPADDDRILELSVPEMDCQSCVEKVTAAAEGVEGVREVEGRAATGRLRVEYDGSTTVEALEAAVNQAGYTVEREADAETARGLVPDAPRVLESPRGRPVGLGAVVLAGAIVAEFALAGLNVQIASGLGRSLTVADLGFLVATALAGTPILRAGLASVRLRRLDIDLLMSSGIAGAVAVGLYLEAAMIAVLFSIAELLERYAMDRARASIRELTDLAADTATVRHDGEERTVQASAVEVGDTVIARPGDRLPVDGVIREGESSVDESAVTGESWPVSKTPGAEVFAGSIVEGGYLEIEATAPADESTIARIAELVADAERNQTSHERFVDRFARYYTPVIVIAAVLTIAVPTLAFGLPWRPWFVRGLTLLVLACPCAFVISTPVGVVSGVTAAARNGVLVKGGDDLEAMGAVDALALDKTGTLTTGELAVTDVVPLDGRSRTAVLACARSLEARSEHPIADAVIEAAERDGIEPRDVAAFESLAGEGVRADLDGVTHYAGNPTLFADHGFDLDHAHLNGEHVATDGGVAEPAERPCEAGDCIDLGDTVAGLEGEGKTVILVGTESDIEGVIAVADTVRPEAARTMELVAGLDLTVVMLTGDNERTARAVADRLGIDRVHAGLLPAEKVDAVDRLTAEFDGIAMVGDGVNDAPALAAADVGVAMGAAGTDAAIETADVALLGDDLLKLPYLVRLSRRATRVIRQNIAGSLGAKVLLALGVPFGLVGVVEAIVIGDMGMSLGVTGNSMRLAGIEPEAAEPAPDSTQN
jgi:Cd2+/Zn2+-exporting ATPase